MLKNSIYLFKEIIRSSVLLNNIYNNLFEKDRTISNEIIAVIGFPRVGNTFAGRVVKLGLGIDIVSGGGFVNHYHSAAMGINSLKLNIPTVLVIREPVDTVLSIYIAHIKQTKISIYSHTLRYIIYHLRLINKLDNLIIIPFNEFRDNAKYIIDKINKRTLLNLNLPDDNIKQLVFESILADKKWKY